MASSQRDTPKKRMRPNIQISHQLNGRVKDYAAQRDLNLDEAYREIIETGLAELEDSHTDIETNGRTDSTPPNQTDTRPDVDRETLRDELAGSGELAESRAGQILAMYDELRELEVAEKNDLLDAVDVDATGYASRDSVWSNMVKGRDTLRALPGVEPPPTGRTEWRWKQG